MITTLAVHGGTDVVVLMGEGEAMFIVLRRFCFRLSPAPRLWGGAGRTGMPVHLDRKVTFFALPSLPRKAIEGLVALSDDGCSPISIQQMAYGA